MKLSLKPKNGAPAMTFEVKAVGLNALDGDKIIHALFVQYASLANMFSAYTITILE